METSFNNQTTMQVGECTSSCPSSVTLPFTNPIDNDSRSKRSKKRPVRPNEEEEESNNEKDIEIENEDDENNKPIDAKTQLEEQQELDEMEKELRRKRDEEQREENELKRVEVRNTEDEVIVTLVTDGYDITNGIFNLLFDEFSNCFNASLICVHVFNEYKDETFNWRFQKRRVINVYKQNLLTHITPEKGHLIIQNFNANNLHPIQQIMNISNTNRSSFMFLSYEGLKTQFCSRRYLNKGIDFLLANSDVPVVIFKEANKRGKNNKGYKWLVIMDRCVNDCFRAFDYFLPMIDIKRDEIFGLTMLPSYCKYDDLQEPFIKKMEEIGIDEERYKYHCEQYVGSVMPYVKEFVNLNTKDYFDFTIFYNNPFKYKTVKDQSDSFKICTQVQGNICFVNALYTERKIIEKKYEKPKDRIIYENTNKDEFFFNKG